MDENTRALIETYEKEKRKTLKRVFLICLLAAGAALIVTAFLFRTQYPLTLQNRGQVYYSYSHILLRDETRYDYFNNVKGHEVKYYIVYRNAGLYYEMETNFSTYSAHANQENARPGVTNHALIKESVEKYTFTDKYAKTYCYDAPTSVLKALFDASYAGGKIYLRFAAYLAGLVLGITGITLFIKDIRTKRKEKEEV